MTTLAWREMEEAIAEAEAKTWPPAPKRGRRYSIAEWTRLRSPIIMAEEMPEAVAMLEAADEWERQVRELAPAHVLYRVYGIEVGRSYGADGSSNHPRRRVMSLLHCLSYDLERAGHPHSNKTPEVFIATRREHFDRHLPGLMSYMDLTLRPDLYDPITDPDSLVAELKDSAIRYVLEDIFAEVHGLDLKRSRYCYGRDAVPSMFEILDGRATVAQAAARMRELDEDYERRSASFRRGYIEMAKALSASWRAYIDRVDQPNTSMLSRILHQSMGVRPVRCQTDGRCGYRIETEAGNYFSPAMDTYEQALAALVRVIDGLASLSPDLDKDEWYRETSRVQREAKESR